MTFLIDGYNLMHAVGSVPVRVPARQFDAARGRFLDWLAESAVLKPYFAVTRIIFDAQHAARDWGTTTHRGLVVTFSFRQTADDLIETYLALDKNPQKIRLVSNDQRLQTAAKRVRAKPMACSEFVDWLVDPTRPGGGPKDHPPAAPEKPESSPDELAEFLTAFRNGSGSCAPPQPGRK